MQHCETAADQLHYKRRMGMSYVRYATMTTLCNRILQTQQLPLDSIRQNTPDSPVLQAYGNAFLIYQSAYAEGLQLNRSVDATKPDQPHEFDDFLQHVYERTRDMGTLGQAIGADTLLEYRQRFAENTHYVAMFLAARIRERFASLAETTEAQKVTNTASVPAAV